MALDNDLIKQHQINQPSPPSTEQVSAAPATATSAANKPVQIIPESSAQENKKPVKLSDEARAKQRTAAKESQAARARSHESNVNEVSKMKAASVSNKHSDADAKNGITKKYIDIIKDENTTPEEKVRDLLREYFTKNNPEFAKLSKEEQDKIIEQKISELISKFNPNNENLSQKDILQSYMKISLLLLKTDKDGVSLDSLSNKPVEELNAMFKKSKKEVFEHFVDNMQNESPGKVLQESIRMYLSVTDANFASKSKKEQNEIINNTKEKFSESFGLKGATEETKERLKNYGLNILKYLMKNNISMEDFSKMSSTEKEKIMVEAALSPNIYEKVDIKTKEKLDYYKTLNAACIALGEGEHTWGEILEYFEKLDKTGNLDDEERKVYNQLKKDNKENAFLPNEKVSFKSNIINALLSTNDIKSDDKNVSGGLSKHSVNELVKDHIKYVLSEVEPNSDLSDEQLMKLIEGANNDQNLDVTNSLITALKEKGWNDESIKKITARIDTLKHLTHCDNDEGASAAEFSDNISMYGTQAQIEEAKKAIDIIIPDRNDEFASDYLAGLKHDDNRTFTDAATSALNRDVNRTDEQRIKIFKIAIDNSTPVRQAIITQSSIETASNEQKLYYGEQYSHINNAAVTEGLAAATNNETNSNIKTLLSSYVDNAIKNNNYSQAEIDNINTARETGKTSYERNVESQTTTSAQAKSETKTSTQQKTQSQTNVTNPSTAKTSSNNATVKLSAANTNSGQQMQQTLLKLQYDSAVAQKEKAMQDLQNIIDKIQNDQEVRAQKQAELAEKAASTDEEIAAAIKEADTKSADIQKNDETKVAQESKESVGVLNEIVETTKVEEVAKKFNISVDDVVTLREAHRQGDLNTIYTKLGSISADAQKKFIQFLSRKDTATIIGFIRNRATDKSLIKELCRLNPNLIKSLDPDLLLDCGIAKADIIKYAGASQLASMLASQARLGHTDVLNQFYEALGYSEQQIASAKRVIPGSAEWESQMNNNMKNASGTTIASTRVRSGNFPGGQTRKKLRPQDYPDYKEYLA